MEEERVSKAEFDLAVCQLRCAIGVGSVEIEGRIYDGPSDTPFYRSRPRPADLDDWQAS